MNEFEKNDAHSAPTVPGSSRVWSTRCGVRGTCMVDEFHQRNIEPPRLSGDGYAMLHPTIPRTQDKLEIIHSSK